MSDDTKVTSTDTISEIDKAINAAKARKANKNGGVAVPATEKPAKEPKAPKVKPTDEEKAAKKAAKDAEREVTKAARSTARAEKKAAK